MFLFVMGSLDVGGCSSSEDVREKQKKKKKPHRFPKTPPPNRERKETPTSQRRELREESAGGKNRVFGSIVLAFRKKTAYARKVARGKEGDLRRGSRQMGKEEYFFWEEERVGQSES